VEHFRDLGTTVTNQNLILKEIRRGLNLGNTCWHSVPEHLVFCLLLKIVKIRIYKTIILPMVLNEHETWTMTLREEYRLRVFENRVLRNIFGLKRDEVWEG
jgi:hypothetical protein